MSNFNLKKFFLYLLIISVGISALIGIGVILIGNFGELETKVLLTTLTVTVTSILGLACGAYLETRRGRLLPITGIACALVSAVMWMFIIWAWRDQNDTFVKVLMSSTLFAASCSHLSLLSLARLEKKFMWSRYAVHLAVWSMTALAMFLIWSTLWHDNDLVGRVMGVLSIVIGALTVITPVFHKLSGTGLESTAIDSEIERLRIRIGELEAKKAEIAGTKLRASDS